VFSCFSIQKSEAPISLFFFLLTTSSLANFFGAVVLVVHGCKCGMSERVSWFERYKAGIAVGSLFRCLFLEKRLLSM
jgi:hypothetical protein